MMVHYGGEALGVLPDNARDALVRQLEAAMRSGGAFVHIDMLGLSADLWVSPGTPIALGVKVPLPGR